MIHRNGLYIMYHAWIETNKYIEQTRMNLICKEIKTRISMQWTIMFMNCFEILWEKILLFVVMVNIIVYTINWMIMICFQWTYF